MEIYFGIIILFALGILNFLYDLARQDKTKENKIFIVFFLLLFSSFNTSFLYIFHLFFRLSSFLPKFKIGLYLELFSYLTVCPRSIDPFYIVSYCIKWVTKSWTYSTPQVRLAGRNIDRKIAYGLASTTGVEIRSFWA